MFFFEKHRVSAVNIDYYAINALKPSLWPCELYISRGLELDHEEAIGLLEGSLKVA